MSSYLTNPSYTLLFAGTLLVTLLLTPMVIRLARKIGAVDHGGFRKINDRPIPVMGGLAIVLPMLGVCLLGMMWPKTFSLVPGAHGKDLMLLAAGGLTIAALGIIDDIRTLRARHKFIVQITVALMVCFAGRSLRLISLPYFGAIDLGTLGGGALTVIWVVGVINAFNLVDGIDGLAVSQALVGAMGLGVVAASIGQSTAVLICLALSGSLLAFLFYNFHPAKIFLGDTGSLFLGYVMAVLPLMSTSRSSGAVMLLVPILALGFPIFDTLSSMGRRVLRGRNPFIGDRAHTHHRLLYSGFTQRQVVVILGMVALLCTVSAVISQIEYPSGTTTLIAVGIYSTVIVAIAWFNGYLCLRQFLQICHCRAHNNRLKNFSRFATNSLKQDPSPDNLFVIMHVGCRELRLGYLEVALTRGFDAGDLEPDADRKNETILLLNPLESGVQEADFLETFYLLDAADHRLMIRYRINHWTGKEGMLDNASREAMQLEYEDVMACLANIFGDIHVPEPDSYRTDSTGNLQADAL